MTYSFGVTFRNLEVHDVIVTPEKRCAIVTAVTARDGRPMALVEYRDGERDIFLVSCIEIVCLKNPQELRDYMDCGETHVLDRVAKVKGLSL